MSDLVYFGQSSADLQSQTMSIKEALRKFPGGTSERFHLDAAIDAGATHVTVAVLTKKSFTGFKEVVS